MHPDDRSDPNENMPAMRARVPEHIGRGAFSTGAIVMTGATEFILDFVQNLGRPHQIVARIVMPHLVMPQFVEALQTNIELYRQRFGPLPNLNQANVIVSGQVPSGLHASDPPSATPGHESHSAARPSDSTEPGALAAGSHDTGASARTAPETAHGQQPGASQSPPQVRRQSAQEVYDDLKLPDGLLSGQYANAVMIGHGPHEFSFDFITNFFPQSAVSSRVFLAAGQVQRLLDSLRGSWEQLRPRLIQPPPPPPSDLA
jgi:hypothetical protein